MTDSETPPPTIDRATTDDRASTIRSDPDHTPKRDEGAPRSRNSPTPEEN